MRIGKSSVLILSVLLSAVCLTTVIAAKSDGLAETSDTLFGWMLLAMAFVLFFGMVAYLQRTYTKRR